MADKNFYTAKLNFPIWKIFSTVLSLSLHCLMNIVILGKEQVMFLALPSGF